MKKDWGFSALVEVAGKRILFDTGNDGETFAANVKAKGVDLTNLDFVILSHRHSDHMAGLAHFCCAENKRFRGGLTLCSCKVCQAGPDYEVMKEPDHVEIGEAEGIVGVHDGCRDELRRLENCDGAAIIENLGVDHPHPNNLIVAFPLHRKEVHAFVGGPGRSASNQVRAPSVFGTRFPGELPTTFSGGL